MFNVLDSFVPFMCHVLCSNSCLLFFVHGRCSLYMILVLNLLVLFMVPVIDSCSLFIIYNLCSWPKYSVHDLLVLFTIHLIFSCSCVTCVLLHDLLSLFMIPILSS